MSMEQDRFLEHARKQDLLRHKPLLRYFLDESFDPEMKTWNPEATEAMQEMYREIDTVKGEIWDSETMEQLTVRWESFGTASPKFTKETTKKIFSTYLMIGYEVGDLDDLQLFTDDFKRKNKDLGLISSTILESRRINFAQEFLFGVAYHGISIREKIKDDVHQLYHPRASTESEWGAWGKFIMEDLDMEGI